MLAVPGLEKDMPAIRRCTPDSAHTDAHVPGTQNISFVLSYYVTSFCRASYANTVLAVIVRPSVRPSVTNRSCTKMAKPRITRRTAYDSPGTLVFRRQKILAKFKRHHPQRGRQIEVG